MSHDGANSLSKHESQQTVFFMLVSYDLQTERELISLQSHQSLLTKSVVTSMTFHGTSLSALSLRNSLKIRDSMGKIMIIIVTKTGTHEVMKIIMKTGAHMHEANLSFVDHFFLDL